MNMVSQMRTFSQTRERPHIHIIIEFCALQVLSLIHISPTIEWDYGTAYEFFISLHVLHQPEHFGIRASWAAGVRSRIPSAERKLLEDIYSLTGVPMAWINSLPAPKDALTALWALRQIPASQRMIKLQEVDKVIVDDGTETSAKHKQFNDTLLRIADHRTWTVEDLSLIHI